MPRKLLQGLLARFCIGRPKVADDNEEKDIVGRIAARLTRPSGTEERWAPDAGSTVDELNSHAICIHGACFVQRMPSRA